MWPWLKKRLPTAHNIKHYPMLHGIAKWLQKRPYLWTFTQHSVAASIAISLFVAFIPLPLETFIVAILAIIFRANLPIAIFSTFFTNIFTLIPISYFNYEVGSWILHRKQSFISPPQISYDGTHLFQWLSALGKPYLLGLPIVSVSLALVSYSLIYLLWGAIAALRKKR